MRPAHRAETAGPTHIKDLVPDPENRRKHTLSSSTTIDRAAPTCWSALTTIPRFRVVLAGNGVLEAAAEAGITRLRVVDADGSEVIAVRRTGLSPEQKRALAIYDNRAAELAEWDPDQLQADASADLTFRPWWSDEEMAEILGRVPSFGPASEDEQGRLDQKKPVKCPQCGHEFTT